MIKIHQHFEKPQDNTVKQELDKLASWLHNV